MYLYTIENCAQNYTKEGKSQKILDKNNNP